MLGGARANPRAADAAEVELVEAALQWCALHPAESPEDCAWWSLVRGFGDRRSGLAGPGAPLLTESAVGDASLQRS